MAGILLILVIVNSAFTGWLYAKVRYLLHMHGSKNAVPAKYVVLDDSDGLED